MKAYTLLLCTTLMYICSFAYGQQVVQNFSYDTTNDVRCGVQGGGCDFTDPTIWVGGISPTNATYPYANGNCSIYISTPSYINIIVNSATTTPYFVALHLGGNVSLTISGNLSTVNYFIHDEVKVNVTNGGVFYCDDAYLTDYCQFDSFGGTITVKSGFYGQTEGQITMYNTNISCPSFMAPYFTCISCNTNSYSLSSVILDYSGIITGGISDDLLMRNYGYPPTNMTVNVPYITGDISLYYGSGFFYNAYITGNVELSSPLANVTFINCNLQVNAIAATYSQSTVQLISSSVSIYDQITGVSFAYSQNCSLVLYCSGSVVAINQINPNEATANLAIAVLQESDYFYFDGTNTPFILPSSSSLAIVYGATLQLLGNVTIETNQITGNGIIQLGQLYYDYSSSATFTSSPLSSPVSVVMYGGTLKAQEMVVGSLYVYQSNSQIYCSSFSTGSFEITSNLDVFGNLNITTMYTQHLLKGFLQVNGQLLVQGTLNMVEDGYNVLYDANEDEGMTIIAVGDLVVNSALSYVTEYDSYFYSEEDFTYSVSSVSNMNIVLTYSFSTYTPNPDPDNYWFYDYWKWYLIFFIVVSVISALVRILFIYQRNRVGYNRIN